MFSLLTPNEKRQRTTKSVQTGASLSSFKKRGGAAAHFWSSPQPGSGLTFPNGPESEPPPPTPPRLASLRFAYTYTQHRPSAGFRNIIDILCRCVCTPFCWKNSALRRSREKQLQPLAPAAPTQPLTPASVGGGVAPTVMIFNSFWLPMAAR